MARIFVVDDTAVILDLYDDVLRKEGYKVYLESAPPSIWIASNSLRRI